MASVRLYRLFRALARGGASRYRQHRLFTMLIPVELMERATLRDFFLPERPGPQTALQALDEPRDMCLVDRWPDPRVVVVAAPDDLVLGGDPKALRPAALRALAYSGMIEAPRAFRSVLEQAYPDLGRWPRVVYTLEGGPTPNVPAGIEVRRLEADDGKLARTLHFKGKWLWKRYRSPEEMAASGLAWAAIANGRCASLALPHTRGPRYEDLGVFTDPSFRGMGLSPACVAKVIEDVKRRGRVPSWSTSVDHVVSQRVAEKMGARKEREDFVYTTGRDLAGSRPLSDDPVPDSTQA